MEMLNEHCGVERPQAAVARLTISNAGRANILSTPVIRALTAGLETLAEEPDLRVLVLTGSGATFVGGADVGEMAALDPLGAETFIRGFAGLCQAIRGFPVPVVARVGGWCLGGGLEVAIACDGRVASSDAQFGMPEVRVGIPSVIHAALIPRLIGQARARWLMLTGATVDAPTALSWGLVDAVAEPGALDAAVDDAVALVLKCAPAAIRAQKAMMSRWDDLTLAEAIEASVPVFGQAFATGEPQRHMGEFLAAKAAKAARTRPAG